MSAPAMLRQALRLCLTLAMTLAAALAVLAPLAPVFAADDGDKDPDSLALGGGIFDLRRRHDTGCSTWNTARTSSSGGSSR